MTVVTGTGDIAVTSVAEFGWWTHTYSNGQIVSTCGACKHWIIYRLDSGGWVHEDRLNDDHSAYAGYVVHEQLDLSDTP